MKFPKNLFNGYKLIKDCKLVKNKDYTQEALCEFEILLNDAQPMPEDMERFSTVKDYYNVLKNSYQKFIRDTPLECTILWTESKSIVNWFDLRGIVYLRYDLQTSKYSIQLHRNMDKPVLQKPITFYNIYAELSDDEEKQNIQPQDEPEIEEYDEDEIMIAN